MCSSTAGPDRQVLPTNVTPTHYDLTLQPNLETFIFYGQEKIDLKVNETTKVITLNTREIKIYTATLSGQTAVDIAYDEQKDLAILTFENPVKEGTNAVLDISFEGILNDAMAGFYRSSYKDAEGNTKYLATTQFEPTDARKAFPCWDEPSVKATFGVTLIVPSELVALSNMDVLSEKSYEGAGLTGAGESKGLKEVKYNTTPVMSTYLVAFCVGPFEYIEAFTSGEHNGRPIRSRVYTLPGSVEQGRHALNVCRAALEYFAKVFGEPYPLPKLDMIAIPDFEAGAMENWGLVTYRTVVLLYDEKLSSIASKKNMAYVVCHELAHQWFGNLVTMEWWEHLWLNEGFATWVGWLAVDNIFPEWDVWTAFVKDDMPQALTLDGLRSSHPIEVTVKDPAEIHQIFDAISYNKGASVIRMLSSWLGVDVFLAGVRRYIQQHKWSNATTNDLWASLSEEAKVDVSKFMNLWTRRVGYPVLSVSQIDDECIEVTQSRYLSTGDVKEEEDQTVWWVPVNILLPDGSIEKHTLTEKTQVFKVNSVFKYKLNAGQTSMYRVNYPVATMLALAEEVKKGKDGMMTTISDRVGLIADAGNLCISGEQSTTTFLELIQAFTNEDSYFVWSQLSTHLDKIASAWYQQPQDIRDGLTTIRRNLFTPLAHRLGWEFAKTDDYLTNVLRVLALANAGKGKDPQTVTEAKKRFWEFVEGDVDAVHPNLRSSVYQIVLSNTVNEDEELKAWEHILKIYRDESSPVDQRLAALSALGSTKNPALIKRYLDMSLDEKEIRGQDVLYVNSSLSANPDARDLLWEFVKTNFDLLHDKFAKSISLLGSCIRLAVGNFVDAKRISEIEKFFVDKNTKEYARSLDQALEHCKVNSQWVHANENEVAEWIRKNIL